MRPFVLLLLLLFLQQPSPSARKLDKPKQTQPTTSQQTSSADQRGTDESPLVVKTIPTPKTEEEAAQETQDRKDKAANDRHIVWFTGALVLIGFLQFLVYTYQAKKLRETVESAGEQAEAMERHIGESARSATAMEAVAKSLDITAKASKESVEGLRQQMRAYLTVIIGTAIYQERDKNLKFDARPLILNAGPTPARKVSYQIKAAILPVPLPNNFDYPLTKKPIGGAIIGAHQNAQMMGVVDDLVPDDQIQDIKNGSGQGLYVWGDVTYEDIFGQGHKTQFCQHLTWLADGKVFGYYIPGHNDAD
jgi:hypothetical protein